jgi:hypothetical protein
MSEYQYYEFQAIDRPLDRAAQEALRSISSRARITATSFTNHYEWGDLKGDPRKFMERWFDLHLYLANWSTRRLMLRVGAPDIGRLHADLQPHNLKVIGSNPIPATTDSREGNEGDPKVSPSRFRHHSFGVRSFSFCR